MYIVILAEFIFGLSASQSRGWFEDALWLVTGRESQGERGSHVAEIKQFPEEVFARLIVFNSSILYFEKLQN